jgi:hypothetical protein
VRLTTYHHIVPKSRNLGALTLLDPSGPAWPVMGVFYPFLYPYAVVLIFFKRLFMHRRTVVVNAVYSE